MGMYWNNETGSIEEHPSDEAELERHISFIWAFCVSGFFLGVMLLAVCFGALAVGSMFPGEGGIDAFFDEYPLIPISMCLYAAACFAPVRLEFQFASVADLVLYLVIVPYTIDGVIAPLLVVSTYVVIRLYLVVPVVAAKRMFESNEVPNLDQVSMVFSILAFLMWIFDWMQIGAVILVCLVSVHMTVWVWLKIRASMEVSISLKVLLTSVGVFNAIVQGGFTVLTGSG